MGEVIGKSQPENNIPQPVIENSQLHQPVENNDGVIYVTELENTLKNMKKMDILKHMKTQNVVGVGMVIQLKH